MANNPIWFNDPMGDTITVSKELMNDELAYEGHLRFMNSKAGKRIQKLYGKGGKHYGTNVVFGISSDGGGIQGGTTAWAINNTTGEETGLASEEDILTYKQMGYNVDHWRSTLNAGERLEFRINYDEAKSNLKSLTPYKNFDGTYSIGMNNFDNLSDAWRFACEYRGYVANKRGLTGVHESQHLRIMHSDFIKSGKFVMGAYNQHITMKNTNGFWFKERFDFSRSMYPNRSDEEISKGVNAFEND